MTTSPQLHHQNNNCIILYAPFGSGKTTVFQFLSDYLSLDASSIVRASIDLQLEQQPSYNREVQKNLEEFMDKHAPHLSALTPELYNELNVSYHVIRNKYLGKKVSSRKLLEDASARRINIVRESAGTNQGALDSTLLMIEKAREMNYKVILCVPLVKLEIIEKRIIERSLKTGRTCGEYSFIEKGFNACYGGLKYFANVVDQVICIDNNEVTNVVYDGVYNKEEIQNVLHDYTR